MTKYEMELYTDLKSLEVNATGIIQFLCTVPVSKICKILESVKNNPIIQNMDKEQRYVIDDQYKIFKGLEKLQKEAEKFKNKIGEDMERIEQIEFLENVDIQKEKWN